MKLILSQYLRTLKERNEFDRLLPDLLLAMGYVPISKPQTGVRQYGVDLAAVGAAEDGIQELLLLVIKRGDVGRIEWDSGPQSVRQSLNEIIDVYLKTLVEPSHESLRKRIVLVTTGDLKQEAQINWDGYAKEKASISSFEFWGADRIAVLVEKHLLNENVFTSDDRTYLRKALALAGEIDYDQRDLHRLFRGQLDLGRQGELLEQTERLHDLQKALRVVNLSAQIYSRWSENEGNLKQALVASERATLWCWHRLHLEDQAKTPRNCHEFAALWQAHQEVSYRYFQKLQGHLFVKDGLSGYSQENAEFSLVVFEQIGLIATIGLCQILVGANEQNARVNFENAKIVARGLAALLSNNPVSGSPSLDDHTIDITLGLLLLTITDNGSQAQDWLTELVTRADYTFRVKRNFPICTDSIDDLAEASVSSDDKLQTRLMRTSWLLATLAGWAVILERDDLYDALARNTKAYYPEVCLQLWHPTEDLAKHFYYGPSRYSFGEAEAPIVLPDTSTEYRERMKAVLTSKRHDVTSFSPACLAGMDAIDLVACRHFRTPVAPFFWYRLMSNTPASSQSPRSAAQD